MNVRLIYRLNQFIDLECLQQRKRNDSAIVKVIIYAASITMEGLFKAVFIII